MCMYMYLTLIPLTFKDNSLFMIDSWCHCWLQLRGWGLHLPDEVSLDWGNTDTGQCPASGQRAIGSCAAWRWHHCENSPSLHCYRWSPNNSLQGNDGACQFKQASKYTRCAYMYMYQIRGIFLLYTQDRASSGITLALHTLRFNQLLH